MSFRLIRHRKDSSHDEIVEALTKAGYVVDSDTKVDLQVRHPGWLPNVFVKLENKRKGFKKPRKDQQTQAKYCKAHGVPYICDAEGALKYVDMHGARLWV